MSYLVRTIKKDGIVYADVVDVYNLIGQSLMSVDAQKELLKVYESNKGETFTQPNNPK